VISSPVEGRKYLLDRDVSDQALGAVLQQEQGGKLKVIAYASRVLSSAEMAYCVARKELLAVVTNLSHSSTD